ncbi:hypothetical protein Ocin01_17810 [Orchesella cincta]|uniref:Uncharacterized protein n=1 Tax=Orchesella cincta TaxID=48709 RepID=A0A1D2M7H7_ORCCI|nr:hypothetical protein Ocin01_17810 [Orchesella cincta]
MMGASLLLGGSCLRSLEGKTCLLLILAEGLGWKVWTRVIADTSNTSCPGSPASEVDTEVVSISTTPRLTRSSGVATPSIRSIAIDVITNKRRILSNEEGRTSDFNDTQIIILDEESQVPVAPSTPTAKKYGLRMRKQRKSMLRVPLITPFTIIIVWLLCSRLVRRLKQAVTPIYISQK